MCGSGTTCKMAKKLNRRFIGCDISDEYVKISKERIKLAMIDDGVEVIGNIHDKQPTPATT